MSGRPKRSLGQNFLVDPNLSGAIVESVTVEEGETVIEIGPGRGALTDLLLARDHPLILIELDRDLARLWRTRIEAMEPAVRDRTTLVEADALQVELASLTDPGRAVVVGNIPYNVTTPILFHLLKRPRPRDVVLMVQREVARRLVAEPGSKEYGALSVGVRSVATVEQLRQVPAAAFRPRPRVESAVVRITPHRPPRLGEAQESRLRRLTRAAFQRRRKQLQRTLRDDPHFRLSPEGVRAVETATGLVLSRRPEELSPTEFHDLAEAIEALR